MKKLLLKLLITFALLASAAGSRAAIINVAKEGTAYSSAALYANWSPSNINDGDNSNLAHADTFVPDGFAYTLDLGMDRAITSIRILPRQTECCGDRLTNFRVSLYEGTEFGELGTEIWGTNLFTDGTNPGSGPGTLVDVPVPNGPKTARWIEIRSLASPVPNYALQIAEVQVMAEAPENEV
ncbi:MAG: discoidin domain-containing protein, partial [Verrucomicrobiales bacterium]